jgi:hypothetical protein
MQRWIAAILDVFNAANGLAMLFASSMWWNSVPGVPDTGPYNPHFVQDVGAAFLVAGLALVVRAWRPAYWPAAVAASGFLVAHGLIHLVMIATGHDHHTLADLVTVIAPADLRMVPVLINGTAGVLLNMDGEIDSTLSMAIDGEKIAAIYLVRNPDKLRHAPRQRLN